MSPRRRTSFRLVLLLRTLDSFTYNVIILSYRLCLETDRDRQGRTGTDRDRQGQTGTDRDEHGRSGMDMDGQGRQKTISNKDWVKYLQ